jgi:hypothetical protein
MINHILAAIALCVIAALVLTPTPKHPQTIQVHR